jgi:glycosyltransferase involved in cell wall biosynthesis
MILNHKDIESLPPPPNGKKGWPWTMQDCHNITKSSRSDLPRLSIVTPSFNQAEYLEQTIRSVLLQGYPNLEYRIYDGGSTDGSLEILKKYSRYLTEWRSEPDAGQASAIAEGMRASSGDIVAWINSDDGYMPGAFFRVAEVYQKYSHKTFIYGNSLLISGSATMHRISQNVSAYTSYRWNSIVQHSTFWTSDFREYPDTSLFGAFDYELWLRILPKAKKIYFLPYTLAYQNLHLAQKTTASESRFKELWQRDLAIIQGRRLLKPSRLDGCYYLNYRFGNLVNKIKTLALSSLGP